MADRDTHNHAQHVAAGIIHGCGDCITTAVTEAAHTASTAALAPLADTMADLIFTRHLLKTTLRYGSLPSSLRRQVEEAIPDTPTGLIANPALFDGIPEQLDRLSAEWLPKLRDLSAKLDAAETERDRLGRQQQSLLDLCAHVESVGATNVSPRRDLPDRDH